MKKITLLLAFLISSIGYAQSPTTAPPNAPSRNAQDVVSIFSNSYADVTLSELPTDWSQLTTFNSTFDAGGTNVWEITGNEFLGMVTNYANGINISSMEKMHIDYWTPDSQEISLKIVNTIDGGEALQSFGTTVTGTWQSVDLDVSGFNVNKTKITQLLLDPATPNTMYVANFYFYKTAVDPADDATLSDLKVDGTTIDGFSPAVLEYNYDLEPGTTDAPQVSVTTNNTGASESITQASGVPGTATIVVTSANSNVSKTYIVNFAVSGPSTAAPTPNISGENSIISFYSDAYTDTTVGSFDAGFCGANSVTEVLIDNNPTILYSGNPCQGINFDSNKIDATSYDRFRIDIFTDDADMIGKTINFKFVDFGGGTAEASNIQIDVNGGTSPILEAGKWITVDVAFTGTKSDLAQIVISTNLGKLWYDNFFIYNSATASVQNNKLLGFSMYPNPATNKLNISAKETIQNADVFNVLGKKVMSVNVNDTKASIDVSNLSSGIYLIKYNVGNTTGTAKFIKQ